MISPEEIRKHEQSLELYVELARQYEEARRKYGQAKYKLHVVLATHLEQIRAMKKNCGMEMSMLILMEPLFLREDHTEEIRGYYKDFIEQEEIYKGLEHRIEATRTQIMYAQSVMRYVKDNT